MKQLRPYQESSIESLRQGIRDGHNRQILCAATGAGKSIMALHLIRSAMEAGKRVMFVCDRRVLVTQFSQHLWSEEIPHGIIMQGHPARRYEKVQVASIQTLERMDGWEKVDLVIVDEIHAVMRASLIKMIDTFPKLKIIGLTATPFNPKLGLYFSSVTNVVTMDQLVTDGFLVPFRVFSATEIDTKGVKVTAGEWQKDQLEERGLQIVGDVIADYVKITNDVFNGEYKKTIVFSAGVGHGTELVKRFAEIGKNFVQISYLDDDDYKADVLRDFARSDTSIDGVISTDILTRGFDQPDVAHVIIAKPLRKSFSQHVQMVGRGARPYPGKSFCVIQDHSGNWLRFSDSFSDLYHDGVKELKSEVDTKKRAELTDKEKEQATCPKCRQIWPTKKTDICPTCGYIRVRKSNADTIAGEMQEIDPTKKRREEKHNREYKESFYRQLLQYARGKNYSDGWAYHKYKERFGVYPHGISKGTEAVNYDTYNWIRSRQIAFSKRSA